VEKVPFKYDPGIARQATQVINKVRKLVAGAVEMVYDNYDGLVIGFVPNEKASLAVLSVFLASNHVTLCFLRGAGLPDPGKRLAGSGNVVRQIKLEGSADLDDPEIRELICTALIRAKVAIDPKAKRKMVIKSVSRKQRPRIPAGKKTQTSGFLLAQSVVKAGNPMGQNMA